MENNSFYEREQQRYREQYLAEKTRLQQIEGKFLSKEEIDRTLNPTPIAYPFASPFEIEKRLEQIIALIVEATGGEVRLPHHLLAAQSRPALKYETMTDPKTMQEVTVIRTVRRG